MITVTDKTACSGCYACVDVCPRKCITMVTDEEGFWYPRVEESLCVHCNLCEKACQAIHPIKPAVSDCFTAWAAYSREETLRSDSSSGGLAGLLAEAIIDKGGVVCGACFTDRFDVSHQWADTKEKLAAVRGSKYVQSRIGHVYEEAEKYLESGRPVLFTGTPCQIDGLLHYLKKPYSQLYTQDIICHGVPSPAVWRKYLAYREEKAGSDAEKVCFRDKSTGWQTYSLSCSFTNGRSYSKKAYEDIYMQGYLANLFLRPSCYNCHSKGERRNSDITLGDFWGVEKTVPAMYNPKGTGLVLIHSEKGQELFSQIQPHLVCCKVNAGEALRHNPSAVQSPAMPEQRHTITANLVKNGIDGFYKKCLKKLYGSKFLRLLKKALKSLLFSAR